MVDLLESFIMSKDEFRDFLKILSFFSGECNDLHIVNGNVLQRTNDRVVAIRCDLSRLMKFGGEIIFCDIKKVVKNLKELDRDSPIRFRRVGNTMRIQDNAISIDIPIGNNVYIDNQKISEEEFNNIFNLGQMILKSEIDGKLCESLKKYAKLTNSLIVTLCIQDKKVFFKFGNNKDNGISQEIKFNYDLFEDMQDCIINLSIVPFCLKFESTLTIYFAQQNNHIVINFFAIRVNKNIAFELYSRAAIITREEEEQENKKIFTARASS